MPPGQGTGLGKPLNIINHPALPDIPILWASLKAPSAEATAEIADGWLPRMFISERFTLSEERSSRPASRSATAESEIHPG